MQYIWQYILQHIRHRLRNRLKTELTARRAARCAIMGLVSAGLACSGAPQAAAGELKLAVASNFLKPVRMIAEKFESRSETTVRISSGSTGKLYAQIKKGAPFDVFLAANAREPERLEAEGDAVRGTRFAYALGRLVLWTHRPGLDPRKILLDGSYKHIAIANPKLAPYGRAAVQVLEKSGVYQTAQQGFITGENVAQAHQFAMLGNVELAFISYSQVVLAKEEDRGSSWLVPSGHHTNISQQAVLLKTGENNPAAADFLTFLKSEQVRRLIVEFGYEVE